MVAQNKTQNIETQLQKPPPRNVGGEDGLAVGFGLLGGLVWAASNIVGALMMPENAMVAWTLMGTVTVGYFVVLGGLLWMGAARRGEI